MKSDIQKAKSFNTGPNNNLPASSSGKKKMASAVGSGTQESGKKNEDLK